MIELDDAIYEHLIADATLAGILPTYEGRPTVFQGMLVPEDAPYPYVVIGVPFVNDREKLYTGEVYWVQDRDISVYFPASGSFNEINQAAKAIARRVNEDPMTVPGYTVLVQEADGPVLAPSDETVYGRLISCHFRVG